MERGRERERGREGGRGGKMWHLEASWLLAEKNPKLVVLVFEVLLDKR